MRTMCQTVAEALATGLELFDEEVVTCPAELGLRCLLARSASLHISRPDIGSDVAQAASHTGQLNPSSFSTAPWRLMPRPRTWTQMALNDRGWSIHSGMDKNG